MCNRFSEVYCLARRSFRRSRELNVTVIRTEVEMRWRFNRLLKRIWFPLCCYCSNLSHNFLLPIVLLHIKGHQAFKSLHYAVSMYIILICEAKTQSFVRKLRERSSIQFPTLIDNIEKECKMLIFFFLLCMKNTLNEK